MKHLSFTILILAFVAWILNRDAGWLLVMAASLLSMQIGGQKDA